VSHEHDEWNNENTAVSVIGIVVAILGAILAIIIVIASLATTAHAALLGPLPAPDAPLQEGGWVPAFIVIGLALVVLAAKDLIRRKK
jgi:hypothetical protein